MATIAAGASANSFLGYGQTVTLTTAHNVSGRYYFVPQNAPIGDMTGAGASFGPLAVGVTIGPFEGPGTIYIENYSGSAAVVTYTVNLGTAYSVNAVDCWVVGVLNAVGASNKQVLASGTGTVNLGATGTGSTTITRVNSLTVVSTDSSGTPGNATNNNLSGRAAFAAAASTVVITNSQVTAASKVFVSLGSADATLTSVRVTPAAGSFTVTGNAAATGTTVFDFLVVN